MSFEWTLTLKFFSGGSPSPVLRASPAMDRRNSSSADSTSSNGRSSKKRAPGSYSASQAVFPKRQKMSPAEAPAGTPNGGRVHAGASGSAARRRSDASSAAAEVRSRRGSDESVGGEKSLARPLMLPHPATVVAYNVEKLQTAFDRDDRGFRGATRGGMMLGGTYAVTK